MVLDADDKMDLLEKAPRKEVKKEDFFEYRGDSCKLWKNSRSRPFPPFAFETNNDDERSASSWDRDENSPLIISEDFPKPDSLDDIATA